VTQSRMVVIVSAVVVAGGIAAALGVRVVQPARAAVGPLPAEALPLLSDARFVMGLDVRRFAASEFHKRYAGNGPMRPDAFHDLESKTGVNPERDVDQVFAAGGTPGEGRGVALVVGRFDRARIARALEAEPKDVTSKTQDGITVYLFREGSKSPGALAFLDDRSILLGTERAVSAALSRHPGEPAPANTAIADLLARVKPGSTFWMVGDQTLLANLPKTVPGGGGSSGSITLPTLKSVVVNGDLDPVVSLSVTGDAIDAAAAKNLADIVRGLVGFAALQASQKPELAQLSSAVTVSTEASQVLVNARLPYDLLDALAPASRPHHPQPPAPREDGPPST
jgi:hypothetical protein